MLITAFLCLLATFQQLVMCTETPVISDLSYVEIAHESKIPYTSLPCAAYSPDGTMLAVASSNNTIELLNPKTYELILTLHDEPTSAIQSIIFSPDSKALASLTGDSRIKTWNFMADGEIKTREIKFKNSIDQIIFEENDKIVVLTNHDIIQKIKLIKGKKYIQSKIVIDQNNSKNISSFALHPKDKTLAVGLELPNIINSITFYDFENAKPYNYFGTSYIYKLQYTPDGSKLIGTYNTDILIMDIKEKARHRFEAHSCDITALAISSDSKFLASASGDKTIKLWDLVRYKLLQTIETGPVPKKLAFDHDDAHLAVASDKVIGVIDTKDIKPMAEIKRDHLKAQVEKTLGKFDDLLAISQLVHLGALNSIAHLGALNYILNPEKEK